MTEEGLAHFDDVALLVFQAIALLRREKAQEWVFRECQGLCDTAFRFKDKENPAGYCSSVRRRRLLVLYCLCGGVYSFSNLSFFCAQHAL